MFWGVTVSMVLPKQTCAGGTSILFTHLLLTGIKSLSGVSGSLSVFDFDHGNIGTQNSAAEIELPYYY